MFPHSTDFYHAIGTGRIVLQIHEYQAFLILCDDFRPILLIQSSFCLQGKGLGLASISVKKSFIPINGNLKIDLFRNN